MPTSHLILCCPLLLLPTIPPSIRVFSNESTLRMRWPKYWSFTFSIIPSKEHPGLISSRMDWLDLLAVPRDSQESSPTPQFKSINSWCTLYINVYLTYTLVRYMYTNILPICSSPFHSNDVFDEKFLILIKPNLSIFYFLFSAFCNLFKKSLPIAKS